jgi:hypothetical protein
MPGEMAVSKVHKAAVFSLNCIRVPFTNLQKNLAGQKTEMQFSPNRRGSRADAETSRGSAPPVVRTSPSSLPNLDV